MAPPLVGVRILLYLAFFSALTVSILAVAPPFGEGPLNNGNFEFSPTKAHLNKTVITTPRALPGWRITGLVEYISRGVQPGGMFFNVPKGVHAVRLGNDASLSQVIHVNKGSLYALTFGASRTCAQNEVLRVFANNQSGDLPLQTIYDSEGGDVYAFGFKPVSDFVKILFFNPGIQEDSTCGPILDLVAIKELFLPRTTKGNLVKNGDFEICPIGFLKSRSGILIPPRVRDPYSPLPGWIIDSLKAVRLVSKTYFSVPSREAAVELIGGRESAIAQIIRTFPNKLYVLRFMAGDARNGCKGSMAVEAFAGKEAFKFAIESHGRGTSRTASFRFRAVSERTRIAFFSSYYHSNVGFLCGPVIDDVRVLQVHEAV